MRPSAPHRGCPLWLCGQCHDSARGAQNRLVDHAAVKFDGAAAGALGVEVGFALAGLRLRVHGREHLQATGAVYASNHSSNIEAPAMFLALRSLFPRVRVLYKAEMRKLPVLVWVFDAAGFVPLERRPAAAS